MMGSIDSIETMGLVDGPGIRCVVFLNGCRLRCKYCHNPEMWIKKDNNYTVDELVNKLLKYKPYFADNGGVTFSGGEPLLQSKFLIEVMKKLKEENIHICLDTAGIGDGEYSEIIKLTDLVLFDIKYTDKIGYKELTGGNMDDSELFLEEVNKQNKPVWIRQVIVPTINDNFEYITSLKEYIKKFNNVLKVELLGYHTLGVNKYEKLNLPYSLKGIPDISKDKLQELQDFLNNN